MFEDDDEYADYDDDLECDCMDEEIDVLTGVAHCSRCGSRRYLSSEDLSKRLKLEADLQADYDRYCEEANQEEACPECGNEVRGQGGYLSCECRASK
ncbi:hypothetical protein [Labrenzia sp. DG1229]|uniref:hypothetical protein n=1 Tax=Labrenzia sp. DG1229 TaxID=681847 RepID=UPI00048E15B3|nr:hypothetical protein [Labrenzia sp. DG1229]